MRYSKHLHIPGFIESIDGDKWTARIWIDGNEYYCTMKDPVSKGAVVGQFFNLHITKNKKS